MNIECESLHLYQQCVCIQIDVVRKRFIQVAQCSFLGFPNLLKIAKVQNVFMLINSTELQVTLIFNVQLCL